MWETIIKQHKRKIQVHQWVLEIFHNGFFEWENRLHVLSQADRHCLKWRRKKYRAGLCDCTNQPTHPLDWIGVRHPERVVFQTLWVSGCQTF